MEVSGCPQRNSRSSDIARSNACGLFEIVHDAAIADFLENFFDEFHVHGVDLVIVLRFFVVENQVQRHLIRLVNHRPMALDHAADVEVLHSLNRAQVLLGAGDQFIGRLRIIRIGPKNNNVRKHRAENSELALKVKSFPFIL
jgi:hypothetical protein